MEPSNKQEQSDDNHAPRARRHEDYTTLYANAVSLEPNHWDLRIMFGEIDQSSDPPGVETHTGMNVSWPMAKVLSYLLRAHILAYEAQNGKIRLPGAALPPDIMPPADNDPESLRAYEMLKKFRQEFIESSSKEGLTI